MADRTADRLRQRFPRWNFGSALCKYLQLQGEINMTSKLAISLVSVACLGIAGCGTYAHEQRNKTATVRSMSLTDTLKQIRTALNESEPTDTESPMLVYPRTVTIELILTDTSTDQANGTLEVAFPPLSAGIGGSSSRQLTNANTVTIELGSLYGIPKDTVGWNVWGQRRPCPDHVKTVKQMTELGCILVKRPSDQRSPPLDK